MDRRTFFQTAAIGGGAAVAAGLGAITGAGAARASTASAQGVAQSDPHITWNIFTRHLQWLTTEAEAVAHPYDTGVKVGEAAAEIGYTAVNPTIRRGGHVDPSQVDVRKNLPLFLDGVRSTGVTCDFITTNIVDDTASIATNNGQEVYAEDLLAIARDEGITRYRWGGFRYDEEEAFGPEITAQLDAFQQQIEGLAQLNERMGMTAVYHTHSSSGRGARSVWDLMHILSAYDPSQLAINFDIGHMTNQGTLSSWQTNLRYAMPYVSSVGLKDTKVFRKEDGTVESAWQQAGTGMVQWKKFFELLLKGGFSGPGESHYEYDVVGLNGDVAVLNTTFWADHPQFASGNLDREFMIKELSKDLVTYKTAARAAGWAPDQLT
ncbi:sugar phosphate isomerase/epimerase family protein [Marinovum sp.]|uniref:sugar phosphate isomerase/epimerase family protein n=1 Tax=Marinovum sp. TaxID=2024839 RepID=UPI002B275E22|nr:TIM barrel protein [Marinovum sp.]